GAGAAGLSAAAALATGGHSVYLVEARERVGGRIHTHEEPDLPVPIELGAEFVHGRSEITARWAQRANSPLIDLADSRWIRQQGKLQRSDSLFAAMKRGLKNARPPKRDLPFNEFLDAAKNLSPRIKRLARAQVEGFDAADANRVSTLETL